MAEFSLPTSTTLNNYRFEIDLDDVSFVLSFKFNSRESVWYMNVLDSSSTLLRAGIKIVNDTPLLRLWNLLDAPEGEMKAINKGTLTEPPTAGQLGIESILIYIGES